MHRIAETGQPCGNITFTEATDPVEVRRAYVRDQLRAACLLGTTANKVVRVETIDEYGHVVSKSPGFGKDPSSYHMPPSLAQEN